jgi:hypothetical protein
MTISCGGFVVLSTAWMALNLCALIGVILVKKAGRN